MLTACVLTYQVGPHDLLIMMRPTGLKANAYQPLQTPLLGDAGEKWDPKKYKRRRDAPTGVLHHTPVCCSQEEHRDRLKYIHSYQLLLTPIFGTLECGTPRGASGCRMPP